MCLAWHMSCITKEQKFKSFAEETKEKTAMLAHKYCFLQQGLGGIQVKIHKTRIPVKSLAKNRFCTLMNRKYRVQPIKKNDTKGALAINQSINQISLIRCFMKNL